MNIAVQNLQNKISIPVVRIKTAVLLACRLLRLTKKEISIVFVGQKRMRSLNKNFLGHDYVTDVITFDLVDSAEIIICPIVAKKNAKVYDLSVSKELLLYVVHGILHLAGYDDHKEKDIKIIRRKEEEILNKIL